jgi:hypothetical protein
LDEEYRVVIVDEKGDVKEVRTLEELIRGVQELSSAKVLIIKGEVLGILSYSRTRPANKHKESVTKHRVVAVLDQMFRGFSDIILREVNEVEVHEIIGRGLESSVKVGERLYRHPAKDDFDVLKIVERLAVERERVVAFFTGDKRLATQATALGRENVKVFYMPPNEYPGKESLAKAMISELRKLLGTS